MNNKIKELNAQIAELTAKRDELLKGNKRWRARKGGIFHYVSDKGSTGCMADPKSVFSDADGFYQMGNYFRTESEAQHARNRMIATQQIKDRIAELNAQHGWVADWSDDQQSKYWVIFHRTNNKISLDSGYVHTWIPVEFYGSKQTAETVIKEMPEQIKLYLGIE